MPVVPSRMSVLYHSLECPQWFATALIDSDEAYPSIVVYSCKHCEKMHSFTAKSSHLLNTVRQRALFETYCDELKIEDRNVYVTK